MTFALDVDRYWLVLRREGQPPIRVDARFLDRLLADDERLVLSIEWHTCRIVGSAHEVRKAVERLATYTRSARLEHHDAYVDAVRRAELMARGRRDVGALAIYFGDDDVYVERGKVRIGKRTHRIADVEPHADLDVELRFPQGMLPASLIMLVVAAAEREEDLEVLCKRIRDYQEAFQT